MILPSLDADMLGWELWARDLAPCPLCIGSCCLGDHDASCDCFHVARVLEERAAAGGSAYIEKEDWCGKCWAELNRPLREDEKLGWVPGDTLTIGPAAGTETP